MKQFFLTYGVPFHPQRVAAVEATLESFGPELFRGGTLRDKLRRKSLHFMSITVVPGDPGLSAHLVIEMSVDDSEQKAENILGTVLGAEIRSLLDQAGLDHGGDAIAFLRRHRIRTGSGLFDVPGLDFCGTPGMSLDRILDEYSLARMVRDSLDGADQPGGTALARLRWHRAQVLGDRLPAPLHHLRNAEPVTPLPSRIGYEAGAAGLAGILFSAAWTLLWPVFAALGLLVIGFGLFGAAKGGVWLGLAALVVAALVALLMLVGLVILLYARLRALEKANQPDDSLPDPALLAEVVAREDRIQQNHLAGISVMQAGWFRRLTLRLGFRVIGLFAQRRFRPGFLGDLGTIHFARWVLLPGTDRLLFFSNYGGSWESYLEDFITKASNGLTGVWSNTVGFPRTENLFQKGAMDGDRFKRWARRQQRPTRFWYSAYPHLTTARIRTNAAIRQGLISAATEDEAAAWFSLIGSSARPADAIETEEVQCIFFGGLKRQPTSASVICALPGDTDSARAWLRDVEPKIVFGEGLPRGTVHVIGFSAEALLRLGLPARTMDEFPLAYRQGMAHPVRSRILSDTGDDQPDQWLWGAAPAPDAVVSIYAEDAEALDAAIADAELTLERHGGGRLHIVRMAPVGGADSGPMREPFGFVDGVSQPIVRGTRRWMRSADAIHAVAPGEFLFGYPDNRGHVPPSPRLPASADPDNLLAVLDQRHSDGLYLPNFSTSGANSDRDFGRNGSFLVIRQLEQDVPGFDAFLADAAREVKGRAGIPADLDDTQLAEWVGAKMVGRWKDGTSIVRHPVVPGTGWNGTKDVQPDNDFLLGAEDPMGLRCPFGAHIRRTNPRESTAPSSMEQLSIVNRHRILRRGRIFDPAGSGDPKSRQPGLFFMCLNLDIERQFEFIQQTWAMSLQFHRLENEVDAILSRGGRSARLTIPTAAGPVAIRRIKDFVRVRGGGYFFMPGRRSIRYLASMPPTVPA